MYTRPWIYKYAHVYVWACVFCPHFANLSPKNGPFFFISQPVRRLFFKKTQLTYVCSPVLNDDIAEERWTLISNMAVLQPFCQEMTKTVQKRHFLLVSWLEHRPY